MTEKRDSILQTGLQLFAEEGYAATSTSKVAKQAGVSEGLIFRHFTNKEGLLNAILEQAMEKTREQMADVVMTADPEELLRKAITLPFRIPKEQHRLWRLVFSLKWQTNQYDATVLEPVRLALSNAFRKLNYKDPVAETELILMFWDGVATAILLHPPDKQKNILKVMLNKYDL